MLSGWACQLHWRRRITLLLPSRDSGSPMCWNYLANHEPIKIIRVSILVKEPRWHRFVSFPCGGGGASQKDKVRKAGPWIPVRLSWCKNRGLCYFNLDAFQRWSLNLLQVMVGIPLYKKSLVRLSSWEKFVTENRGPDLVISTIKIGRLCALMNIFHYIVLWGTSSPRGNIKGLGKN